MWLFFRLVPAYALCGPRWRKASYQSLEEVPSETMALVDRVHVLRGNEVYRFGDVIVGRSRKMRQRVRDNAAYNGTILYEWLHSPNPSMGVLAQLATAHARSRHITIANDTALVVHVRSGDQISGRGLGNPLTRQDLKNVMALHLPFVSEVIVVTALHYGVKTQSVLYKSSAEAPHRFAFSEQSFAHNKLLLARFLDSIPCPVKLRSSQNPDDDFAFMALAPRFAATVRSGAFSKTLLFVRSGRDHP